MINIDYDILFSVKAELVSEDGSTVSNNIPMTSWRFAPTSATVSEMKRHDMLFKQIGPSGLMLAPPTGSATNDNGEEVAEFDLLQDLRFTIQIGLSPPTLLDRIDLGPGPRDDDPNFPDERTRFFAAVFPGSMPVYVVDASSQSPVDQAAAVAPPVGRLAFDKTRFVDISLKGPLPDREEIPPLKIRVFESGQASEVEDPNVFEYPVGRISESKYLLEGKRVVPEAAAQDFAGEIFLSQGSGQKPGVAYVQVDLPAGKINSGEKKFTVRFKEK